jgi:hypothetical protein
MGVTGGWIQGKPVTALMRQLMKDGATKTGLWRTTPRSSIASLILERWGLAEGAT